MSAWSLRSTPVAPSRPSPRTVAAAALADAAGVVLFAAVGRSSHAEGLSAAGLAVTSWPFLVGAAAGWALSRAWRRPTALGSGALVWAGAVVAGMGLRVAAGQGTALSFTVVTAVVLGVLLVGWRAVLAAADRRASRARPRGSA